MVGKSKSKSSKGGVKQFYLGLLYKILIAIAGLIALVAMMYLLSVILPEIKVKSSITQYLKSKYNEEFVVEKPEYKNGGFGVKGIWVSRAYPANNPQLDFSINCSSTDTSDCSDQYVAALWSIQATEELKDLIDDINADNEDKINNAQIKITVTGDIENSVNKSSSYSEYKSSEDDIKHLVVLNVSSSSNERIAVVTDKVIKGLLEQDIKLNKIDINVSSGAGTCKAYDLPTDITADFINKCNNSRLEWYNGN